MYTLITYSLYACLQALDTFITPIPRFEGGTPIPTIPLSAQTLSAKSVGASSKGSRAGSSKTRAGKCKVVTTLPTPKKARKVTSKKPTGVKINDLAPNPSPTLTPPDYTQDEFTMR
jgi:hypothetical protein